MGGIVTLLWLLILVVAGVGLLTGLEALGGGLEGGGAGAECLGGGRVVVEVHLLRLARQVVVLRGGGLFPRVEVRHGSDVLALRVYDPRRGV